MIVRELISDILPSVLSSDTASRALSWMGEFKLSQLPIVDEGKYVGLITEDDILDAAAPDLEVGEMKFSGWDSAYIYEENHIYDGIDLMSKLGLEILPVLDEENTYLGVITFRDISRHLGTLFALQDPGGILVLQVRRDSYVLSEIGRIVESEDAAVLSLYLSASPISNDLLVTMKLNVEDLSRVVSSFERFDYQVVRVYHRGEAVDDYRRNLDALIKYLEM
ncbi:MAG: CBS domain-containing protein [Bacteroidota bacterium]